MNDHAAFAIMPILFCITTVFLHKEIMLLIQIIPCNIQSFTEPLEMNDFPFPQELNHVIDIGVIGKPENIIVGDSGFLF